MRRAFWTLSLVVLATVSNDTSLAMPPGDYPSRERYNFFDTELFRVISKMENRNVLISPLSIKLLLGLLLEGADGFTAEEIRLALRLPKGIESTRREFDAWLSSLQVKKCPRDLNLANHVFLSDKFRVKPDYEAMLKTFYGTDITAVKFDKRKETSRVINEWVSKQTFGFIPSVVREDQVEADSKLMLMSAVYFKGLWMTPFSENKKPRCFYSFGEKCQRVAMMSNTGNYHFGYVDKLDARALKIPYKGGKYFMLLLLPSKRNSIDKLSQDLIHVSIGAILSETKLQEVLVQIPKFEILYENDLVDSLKKCELSSLFGDKANFSNIFADAKGGSPVDSVFHSTRIKMNEGSSEVSAATGALFVPLMGGTTTTFVANHPFLFFIVDSTTHTIIFAGKLMTPTTGDRLFGRHKNHAAQSPAKELEFDTLLVATTNKTLREANKKSKVRLISQTTKPRPVALVSSASNSSHQTNEFHKIQTTNEETSKNSWFSGTKPDRKPSKSFPHREKQKNSKEPETTQKNNSSSLMFDSWRHHILLFS